MMSVARGEGRGARHEQSAGPGLLGALLPWGRPTKEEVVSLLEIASWHPPTGDFCCLTLKSSRHLAFIPSTAVSSHKGQQMVPVSHQTPLELPQGASQPGSSRAWEAKGPANQVSDRGRLGGGTKDYKRWSLSFRAGWQQGSAPSGCPSIPCAARPCLISWGSRPLPAFPSSPWRPLPAQAPGSGRGWFSAPRQA